MREHIGLRGVRREMAHISPRGVEVISVDVRQIVVARAAGAARYQRSGETLWINGPRAGEHMGARLGSIGHDDTVVTADIDRVIAVCSGDTDEGFGVAAWRRGSNERHRTLGGDVGSPDAGPVLSALRLEDRAAADPRHRDVRGELADLGARP